MNFSGLYRRAANLGFLNLVVEFTSKKSVHFQSDKGSYYSKKFNFSNSAPKFRFMLGIKVGEVRFLRLGFEVQGLWFGVGCPISAEFGVSVEGFGQVAFPVICTGADTATILGSVLRTSCR